MNEMPRVGAKIRVTVIHPDGETVEASGPLIDICRYSDDSVTWLRLPGGLLFAVEDGDSAVTVEELEPPKPALPAEPGFGLFVACGGDGNLLPFFRRWHEGWLRVDGDSSDYTTWPEICALSRERAGRDPVLLVPAPDLADMVILWRSDAAAYCDRVHGSGFDKCGNSVCADRRALMTKYETGATA